MRAIRELSPTLKRSIVKTDGVVFFAFLLVSLFQVMVDNRGVIFGEEGLKADAANV